MDTKRSKRMLYGTLMAVGVTVGAAGIANAATSSTPTTTTTSASAAADAPEPGDTADPTGDVADEPSYQSSVTVAQGASEQTSETDEAANLAPLATITAEQAKQAALGAAPGTVVSAQLEDENGNVVSGVEVTTASVTVDVKVDAGNAEVLSQEAGGAGGERRPLRCVDGRRLARCEDRRCGVVLVGRSRTPFWLCPASAARPVESA